MISPAPSPALPRRRFLGRMLAAVAGASFLGWPKRAKAVTQGIEPYLGEIMLWAGTFAPRGWALCNGQVLSISQNTALFSLLGTTYGGNGQTTFALPDLRGRTPMHFGQGPGLSARALGEKPGEEAHLLVFAEMPSHTHTARGTTVFGTSASPAGMVPARSAAQIPQFGPTADTLMAPVIAAAGGGQPHENHQPYLALNYVIALQGVYPSQSMMGPR